MEKAPCYERNSELYEIAKRMRANGETLLCIGRYLGVHWTTVQTWLSPERREKVLAARAARNAKRRKQPKRKFKFQSPDGLPPANLVCDRSKQDADKAAFVARFQSYSQANRDKTAQFFGDPLPERSALAQERAEPAKYKAPPIVPYEAELRADGIGSNRQVGWSR